MSDPNQKSDKESSTAVVVAPKREIRVVEDDSPIAYLLDTARFDHCYRIAGAMARASLIPKHLMGDNYEQTQANCFLVVNQALRWQMDPFAVAPETYEVGGKLAYQGKLVAAVINARAGLAEKLSYTFNEKAGDALEITVSGRFRDEAEPRTVTVSVGQARTNNQMWTKDPYQKLVYTGAIRWARRHKPEIILGVLSDDDADAIREEAKFMAATPVKRAQLTDGKSENGPADQQRTTEPEKPKKERVRHATMVEKEPEKLNDIPSGVGGQPSDKQPGGETASDVQHFTGAASPTIERPPFVANPKESEGLNAVRRQMHLSGISEEQVMKWARKQSLAKDGQKLADLSTAKLTSMADAWERDPKTMSEKILAVK